MDSISAVIITHNEARNISRCIASLRDIADEVVVVDSGSTDETETICLKMGAKFHKHDWEGYSGQKNYANTLASGPWILSLDADEALSDPLRQSLLALKTTSPHPDTVFSFNRLTNFCGSWIRHCGWYPDEKIRLWHQGCCHWSGLVHEELQFNRPIQKKRLSGQLLHYSYYSVEELAARQVKYASMAAQKAHQQGKKSPIGVLWLKPMWTFVRNYLFKGGIMDGKAGFIVCRMTAFYTLVKYTRLRELTKEKTEQSGYPK